MKKYLGFIIGGVVLAGIVIWVVFYTINNRKSTDVFSKKSSANSEAQAIISKDLDRFYPSSAREVVRFYQRINVCLMTKEYTEDEFYKLVDQMRALFDDELFEKNPRGTHAEKLYYEVETFKKEGRSIPITNLQLESQAEKYKKDGKNMASIVALFVIKDKKGITKSYEKFVLREDENGNWKILGWELTEPVDFLE
ncbi:MAG: hypothetical protein K6F63_00530 [Lachnospiraceae bacterium]|nr:hypothetical protein [Lachnospiraceae bacterium]